MPSASPTSAAWAVLPQNVAVANLPQISSELAARQELYRLAYAKAQAAVDQARFTRRVLSSSADPNVWN